MRLRRKLRVGARNFALGVAVSLAGAAAIERWCEAKDFERYASKETFADVAGARVRYRFTGREQAGSPVVLLTGMIASLEQWDSVQNELSTFAPTLAYDRAGGGFSSNSWAHDVQQQGDELSGLLTALGVSRPVVVVGYSASGSLARMFAAQHRAQVAGLVLIDPDMPELDVRMPQHPGPYRMYWRTMGTCSLLAAFAVRRAANQFGFLKFEPPPHTELDYRTQAILQRFPHWWAFDRELFVQPSSDRQVLAQPRLENIPVSIFMTADAQKGEQGRIYAEVVRDKVAGRPVLKSLGEVEHSLIFDQRESAKQIIGAVREQALALPR